MDSNSWSSRPNCFEVDLDAIAHNVRETRRIVGPGIQLYAALKANGYGYGLVEAAETVLGAGADAISLADLGDAIRLRDRGFSVPVLLYAGNLVDDHTAPAMCQYQLMPTVLDLRSAEILSQRATHPLQVFVKVDVGLERLGVGVEEAVPFITTVSRLPRLVLHGVYTHMSVSNLPEAEACLEWQFQRFESVLGRLDAEGIRVPMRMAASTRVLRLSSSMALNAVDPGHMLYGLNPPGPTRVSVKLRPAFRALKSRLIQVKRVDRTEFLDHAPFPIRQGMRIGIIPIGLSDGMPSLNCGEVIVRGRRAPILGSPSLEHTRVDLTGSTEAEVGDEVVIIGRQAGEEITCDEVMARRGVQPVELALAVRETVPRRYVKQRIGSAETP